MSLIARTEEKLIPLKAIWALNNPYTDSEKTALTQALLFDMPHLEADPAIILGSTRATAFAVRDAVEAGHQSFILLGGKPVGQEDRRFTDYIMPRLAQAGLRLEHAHDMTEADYAALILTNRYGVSPENIIQFDDDRSMHTSGNMQVLKKNGYDSHAALELYTLSGFALRTLQTARKILGPDAVISVHNAFPAGVRRDNWDHNATARAFIAMEAAKTLPGKFNRAGLYERLGHTVAVNMGEELRRCRDYQPA